MQNVQKSIPFIILPTQGNEEGKETQTMATNEKKNKHWVTVSGFKNNCIEWRALAPLETFIKTVGQYLQILLKNQ